MSRTYRAKPSSKVYFRRMKHIGSKRASIANNSLEKELLLVFDKRNRITSQLHNPPDPWDGFIVSHYRGQKWNREVIAKYVLLQKEFSTCYYAPNLV